MSHVIKIKYEDILRRLTFQSKPRGDDLSFERLESRIRDLFKLNDQTPIRVTYIDKDADIVTMADDVDLADALIIQQLNPLRLYVSVVEAKSSADITPIVLHSRQRPAGNGSRQDFGLSDSTRPGRFEKNVWSGSFDEQFNSSPRPLEPEEILQLEKFESSNLRMPTVPLMRARHESAFPPFRSSSHVPTDYRVTKQSSEAEHASLAIHNGVQCDGCGMNPIVGSRYKSIKKYDFDLCPNCFQGHGSKSDYTRIDRPLFRPRHLHPPMRCPALNSLHAERQMPIRAPHVGRPEVRSHQGPLNQPMSHGGKLDARFVQDVTIFDGTELMPGTHFTKTWRLRNSGRLPWPTQTKLVHVGGDELGSCFVVPLEISEPGLLPDEEMEVSVELVAPDKPGRYVSHWRLASPSGPKFGHRVWVLIQVVSTENNAKADDNRDSTDDEIVAKVAEDAPLLSAASDVAQDTSEPPQSDEGPSLATQRLATNSVSRDAFVKASHEALVAHEVSQSYPSGQEIELRSSPTIGITPSSVIVEKPLCLPFDNFLQGVDYSDVKLKISKVDEVFKMLTQTEGLPFDNFQQGVDYSDVKLKISKVDEVFKMFTQNEGLTIENSGLGGGFSMVERSSSASSQVTSAPDTPRGGSGPVSVLSSCSKKEDAVEIEEKPTAEALAAKLAAMGFVDHNLNLELLTKNKLNLRRTLDDFFAAAEWDPILKELEQMGFYDTDMNRRLMFKNNGSVKRVVKELVQMYKEPAIKAKEVVHH